MRLRALSPFLFLGALLTALLVVSPLSAPCADQHRASIVQSSHDPVKQGDADTGKTGAGQVAGNGASGSGRTEAILVAQIVLLLVVGRLLGEGMQRIG